MTTAYLDYRRTALDSAADAVAVQIADRTLEFDGLADGDPQRVVLQEKLDALHQLREEVAAEQELLTTATPEELTDQMGRQALMAWLAEVIADPGTAAAKIVTAVDAEPVHHILGQPAAITPALAAAIVAAGHDTADDIRAAFGDVAFEELVGVARTARLRTPEAERAYLFRDVAVLLPLRLETVFEPDGANWTMLLRIIPDEASVLRHDPAPTPTEIAALSTMWASIYDGLAPAVRALPPANWLNTELVDTPWESLCGKVGGARAAWLAGNYPPQVTADGAVTVEAPDAVEHEFPPNYVGGMPSHIEIWCTFRDGSSVSLGKTSQIDSAALKFDVIGARDNGAELEDQSDRWWVSWDKAKEVGLGFETQLPGGRGPRDITALYAIGVGDDDPAEHFRGLIDAGEFAPVPRGGATNTVDGQPTVGVDGALSDWHEVAVRRLEGTDATADPTELEITAALTGAGTVMPAFPRQLQRPNLDRLLVQTLGPALWGHYLHDLWGFGADADNLCLWAMENLRPEGPLPPIRIAEQPYGLLPVSAMSRWSVSATERGSDCEPRILQSALRIRELEAEAAQHAGNAVGADTERLMESIGIDGLSERYVYRSFFPAALWANIYTTVFGPDPIQIEKILDGMLDPPRGIFAQHEARGYLGLSECTPLDLPLVLPTRWPEGLAADDALRRILRGLAQPDSVVGLPDGWQLRPDSLLIRLLWYSRMLADAAVNRTNSGVGDQPLLEPFTVDDIQPTELHQAAGGFSPPVGIPGRIRETLRSGIFNEENTDSIFGVLREDNGAVQLERALRATLDTATHRIDPWLTGMATRRLSLLTGDENTRYRLGVYGWVDGPFLGDPGPTNGGLLHAPSHAQAMTAVVLRDRYLSDQIENPDDADRWSMQLESARILIAEELADDIRIGSHIFEAVGRQVERVVSDQTKVSVLREKFPMHTGQNEAGRVCHGLEALANLRADNGAVPVVDVAGKTDQLDLIHASLDCYSDLLVAESVHQFVSGRAEIAGAAMDTAAGFGTPPSLAFTETPLVADALSTSVIAATPWVEPGADAGPARLADASVATAISNVVGKASDWTWTTEDGAASATLEDVGLEPIDTVSLSPDFLGTLVVHRLGRAAATGSDGWRRQLRAKELVRSFGSQPAFFRDIAATNADPVEIAKLDSAIADELLDRYTALRTAATALRQQLTDAKDQDAAAMAAALRTAILWGITPQIDPAPEVDLKEQFKTLAAALLDFTPPDDPELLPSQVDRALKALEARIKAAPELPAPGPEAHQMARAEEGLGRAIAELAAPEGQLAVLAKVGVGDLNRITGLVHAEDNTLDEDWLTLVAAVRPHLARLEALQLAATPFGTWSNCPDDHWQSRALGKLRADRKKPGANPFESLPRFIAAYATADLADDGDAVGIGLVDSWGEAAPRPIQTTTAAFGFNAPSSRPPQAILIAVPPDLSGVGAELTNDVVTEIVSDTRQLALARAAQAHQLGGLLGAIPTAMFSTGGWTGVRLDSSTKL